MKNLVLPSVEIRPLAFYLAMEEWAAHALPEDEYFFAWRVHPTVICGRNQDIAKEVNLQYCREQDIHIVRRKSGGGCVYADMNNFMFSYICPDTAVGQTFSRYTLMIASILQSLGIDAKANGRNDITVADKKISGNAFYKLPHRSIVHGTMLYDIDYDRMARAITPSRSKLESKAVQSVGSRITSLREQDINLSIQEFEDYATSMLTSDTIVLTNEQVGEIQELEKHYYNPEFIRGKFDLEESAPDLINRVRIDNCGEFEVKIYLDSNHRIKNLTFFGDFFLLSDIKALISCFVGVPYEIDAVQRVAKAAQPERYITNLTHHHLLSLLFHETNLPLQFSS